MGQVNGRPGSEARRGGVRTECVRAFCGARVSILVSGGAAMSAVRFPTHDSAASRRPRTG